MMCGHYGWLAAAQKIDHPCAKWNSGRIYIHRCDVEGGLTLVEGDRVTFFLYVDDEGLGAEGCRLQRWDSADSDIPKSNATAVSTFKTFNPAATEFVPAALPAPSALAAPGPGASRVTAPFPSCFAFNIALLDDFTDDEDDDSTVSVSGEELRWRHREQRRSRQQIQASLRSEGRPSPRSLQGEVAERLSWLREYRDFERLGSGQQSGPLCLAASLGRLSPTGTHASRHSTASRPEPALMVCVCHELIHVCAAANAFA